MYAKKVLLVASVVSLIIASCKPAVTEFIPGESGLPNVPIEGENFHLRVIEEKSIPEPVNTKPNIRTLLYEEHTDNIIVQVNTVSATTNIDGLVAISDPEVGGVIPVLILDEDDQPIRGVTIKYLSEEQGDITIFVSDPDGEYQPQLIRLNKQDLFVGIQSDTGLFTDLFGVQTVYASRETAIVITAAIVVTLIKGVVLIGTALLTADNAVKAWFNRSQVVGEDQQFEYICRSPEYFYSKSGLVTEGGIQLIVLLSPVGTLIGGALSLGNYLLEDYAENAADPILFKRYIYPDVHEELLVYDVANVDETQEVDLEVLEPMGAEVGKCAEVPDVVGLRVSEARSLLSAARLLDGDNYVIHCAFATKECENGVINWQDPPAISEEFPVLPGGKISNMIPVGVDGSFKKLHLTVDEVALDYSNLDYFKMALKEAIEGGNFDALRDLIKEPFTAGQYWSEYWQYTREEAISYFEIVELETGEVDISDRGDLVTEMMREVYGPSWESPVYLTEGYANEDQFLLLRIIFENGRYWWSELMQVPLSLFDEDDVGPFPKKDGPETEVSVQIYKALLDYDNRRVIEMVEDGVFSECEFQSIGTTPYSHEHGQARIVLGLADHWKPFVAIVFIEDIYRICGDVKIGYEQD